MPKWGTLGNREICPNGPLHVRALLGHDVGTMPNNISHYRKARGISQQEMADRLGTTLNMFGKLERGDRTLNENWLQRISAVLEVRASQLIDDDEPVADILDGAKPIRPIPLLGKVPAGNWREAIRTAHHFIPAPAAGISPEAYALEVDGNSMDRIVQDGATIIIDPTDLDVFDKRLFIVQNSEGEVTFKQYRERPARLVPCSTDPANKVIPIGTEQFKLLGRVIKYVGNPEEVGLD